MSDAFPQNHIAKPGYKKADHNGFETALFLPIFLGRIVSKVSDRLFNRTADLAERIVGKSEGLPNSAGPEAPDTKSLRYVFAPLTWPFVDAWQTAWDIGRGGERVCKNAFLHIASRLFNKPAPATADEPSPAQRCQRWLYGSAVLMLFHPWIGGVLQSSAVTLSNSIRNHLVTRTGSTLLQLARQRNGDAIREKMQGMQALGPLREAREAIDSPAGRDGANMLALSVGGLIAASMLKELGKDEETKAPEKSSSYFPNGSSTGISASSHCHSPYHWRNYKPLEVQPTSEILYAVKADRTY